MFLCILLAERYPSRQVFDHILSSLVAVLLHMVKQKSTGQRSLYLRFVFYLPKYHKDMYLTCSLLALQGSS